MCATHSFVHILYNTETCNECCLQISSTFYIQLPTSLSLAHTHTHTNLSTTTHIARSQNANMRIHSNLTLTHTHTNNIVIHGRKTSLKCYALQFTMKLLTYVWHSTNGDKYCYHPLKTRDGSKTDLAKLHKTGGRVNCRV